MEQNTICLDDILSGKANEMYPDFLTRLINGSISVILTSEESERVKEIEQAIHALDLASAVDRTDYLGESVMEPLTEAGGAFSWFKRIYTGRDANIADQLNDALKECDDEHTLQKVIDESDDFLEEAQTHLAMFHHPAKIMDGLSKEDATKSLQTGFGKRFIRLIKMYFASFGFGFLLLPAAFITSAFSSTEKMIRYTNSIRSVRDAAQARLDKLKKKGK